MIISGKGFTKTAIEAANAQKIVLKTYNQLLSDLNTFYSLQKPLIQDLDSLISQ
jgi:phage tail tape-measure protein